MTEIKPGNGKPDVILLNGPSSAGKSSIAKALRQLLLDSGANAVILSLDDYLQMSTNEPIWEDDVFAIIPRMCADIRAALQDGKTKTAGGNENGTQADQPGGTRSGSPAPI